MADELIDLPGIAAEYGVAYNTAWRWSQRDDFPKVVERFASRPVWKRAKVAAWAARHLPLKPGPKPDRDE